MSKYNLTRIKGLLIRAGIEFETNKDIIKTHNEHQEICIISLTESKEIVLNGKVVTDRQFEKWICNWR